MAKRKTLTPIQKAYRQQVDRIHKELTQLRRRGRPTKALEEELQQILSTRPTKKKIEQLKKEYSSQRMKAKAGLIRTGKGWITKEQYEYKREQRWERQREAYEIKKQQKQQKQIQKTKDYWDTHLPEIVTSKSQQQPQPAPPAEGQPPKLSDLVYDRVKGMINDTSTSGADMLNKELNRQIEKYGLNAVTGAMEQIPKQHIEEMETLIKYGNNSEQNSQTIAKIAEAIKSEILNPTERKQIATIADEEEEYG